MVLKTSQKAGSFLLALVMLLSLTSVFCFKSASAATDGEWKYELENGGVTITGFIGTSRTISVPSKVNGQRVKKVTALNNNNTKASVTTVSFANGIEEIGTGVCKGYISLERVALPDTLVTIGSDAFFNCSSLTGITIPNSVTTIGTNAFNGCIALISADLSCKATVIPDGLFTGCKSLTTAALPSYTTDIGVAAFSGCSSLASINIPDTVKTIAKDAFNGCASLKRISLSTELKTIGEMAFKDCTGLTEIFIPNKVKTISEEAFSGCTSLQNAYIGSSVSVIKKYIFSGCTALKNIVFGGDYYNFTDLSSTAVTGTYTYYPSKYADGWSHYDVVNMKSYSAPTSVAISGTTEAAPGAKVTLKVTATPAGGEFNNVYVLKSSNPNVASISDDGTIIARATGITTITAYTVSGASASVTFSVTPDKPQNLTATAKTTTSAELTWKEIPNVTGYNIYRSTSKNGTFKKVGSATTNSYTDKGLSKGKTYYYKVACYVNSDGKQAISAYSSVVSVKAAAPAPAQVSAKKAKSGAAKITWSKSTGANGYEVYMAASANGKFTKAGTISKSATVSFNKSGLKSGKTYFFKVRAYTTVGGKKVYSDYTKTVKVKV